MIESVFDIFSNANSLDLGLTANLQRAVCHTAAKRYCVSCTKCNVMELKKSAAAWRNVRSAARRAGLLLAPIHVTDAASKGILLFTAPVERGLDVEIALNFCARLKIEVEENIHLLIEDRI